jgi:hypothetical protein
MADFGFVERIPISSGDENTPSHGRLIERHCGFCGVTMLLTLQKKGKKFCGKPCYHEHQKTVKGENSPNFGKRRTDEFKARMSILVKSKQGSYQGKNTGKHHPQWRGGKTIATGGYVLIHISELSDTEREWFSNQKNDYVAEHRVVVSRRLGRQLKRSEHIHHINGIKGDNRDENLMLFDSSRHMREHANIWKHICLLESENKRLRGEIENLRAQIEVGAI